MSWDRLPFSRLQKVGLLLCLVGAAVCLVWAGWHAFLHVYGVRAPAVVTHVDPQAGNKYGRFTCAYKDEAGVAHELQSSDRHFTPRLGTQVFVRYLPTDPSVAEFDGEPSNLMRGGYKVLYALMLMAVAVWVARGGIFQKTGSRDGV